jgi:outer membrane receptor protein involved in Fe transport
VQPLAEPDAFAPIIERVPDDVDSMTVAAILNEPFCIGCFQFTPNEIGAIIDLRLNNLNRSEVAGIDLDFSYGFERTSGSFDLSLHASHLLHFKEQPFASGPLEDHVDTFTKPNSLQIRSAVSWTYSQFRAALIGNHIGDYTSTSGDSCQTRPAGFCEVGSWTTWDLNVGYDFTDTFGFLAGTKLSVSVSNILNEDPPFVQVAGIGVGFDPFNANPLGRFVAAELAREW